MKKLTLISIAIMFAMIVNLSGQNQSSVLANLDEFILEKMETFHVPGLSASIIIGDSVVWNNNYGFMNLEDSIPVNDSTLFNVFSIGKSLTSACVMQLWDKQFLGLDQNINDFLPFQIENPWNDADSITARMLMSHSSSINDGNIYNFVTIGDPTISLDYFLENYLCPGGEYYSNNNYYNALPGTVFHYSNYGIALNGYLIEPLTGISFNQYASDSLLTPLEMNNSAWFLDELNIDNLAIGYSYSGGNFVPNQHLGHPAYPGVSLRSTALELANCVIMLSNEGMYNDMNILTSDAVDSMTTIQNPAWTFSYGTTGLGLFTRDDYGDRIVWGHNGGSDGGYAAHFYFCKEENSGIVITTNSEQYVDPIVLQMFEYAGLMVFAESASQISDSSFYANWQPASISTGYLLDVAYNEQFTNFLTGYENLDVGLDTTYSLTGLSSNTNYFFRLRSYNATDTGAYSNIIGLTTLLGTGVGNAQSGNVKIWSSGKTVNIDLTQNQGAEAKVSIYSLSGQCLGSFRLIDGLNSIPLYVKRQPLCVKVSCRNKNFYKKVMVW